MSTDSDAAWAEVERAAISRFSGATAEDDDLLAAGNIGEAMLNPNRQGGGGQGAGGPGMMPPMMGMGGGGGGGAGGGGAGGGLSSAAPMTTTAIQPQASAGIPVSTAPTAAEAKPEGEGEVPELPGGLGGGGLGGGLGGGGGQGELGGGGLPGGGNAGGPQTPVDGFAADPVALRGMAAKWEELAQELRALTGGDDVDPRLGIPVGAEPPQLAVNQQVVQWRTGAVTEFDALVSRLHEVAGKYEAAEESSAAEARKGTQE